jgi:hypothetical protein
METTETRTTTMIMVLFVVVAIDVGDEETKEGGCDDNGFLIVSRMLHGTSTTKFPANQCLHRFFHFAPNLFEKGNMSRRSRNTSS